MPIAAGENESGRHEFQPWIDNHALASPTHPMATRMPVCFRIVWARATEEMRARRTSSKWTSVRLRLIGHWTRFL